MSPARRQRSGGSSKGYPLMKEGSPLSVPQLAQALRPAAELLQAQQASPSAPQGGLLAALQQRQESFPSNSAQPRLA